MIVAVLALFSGAMFYLSQGLDDVWPLAWIAAAPLLWLAYGNCARWQLFAAGVCAFSLGQAYLIQCYPELGWIVLRVAVLPCLLFGAVLLFARLAGKLSSLAALFAFPAAWAGVEYVLGSVLQDGPVTALANAQVSFPAGIQVASLFGFSAVSFLLCLFANALALLLQRRRTVAGIGMSICAAALAFGWIRLQQPQAPTLYVAALANSDERARSFKGKTVQDTLTATTTYAATVRELAGKGRIDIVAIPEAAIRIEKEWKDEALAPLAAAARDTGAQIVIGTIERSSVANRAFALYPDGGTQSYDKRHLLRPLETYIAGTEPGLLRDGRAMAICKDMDFPRTVRGDARSGVQLMIVPASDFNRDGWIHARIAILRGVENGFAMLRSTFDGLHSVTDAQGRVVASADTSRSGTVVLTAVVAPGNGPTLYTHIGDVFAWACVALSLTIGAAALLPANSRQGGGPD